MTETVSWGVLYYAIGVLVKPMERDLGWSRSTVLGAFSLALLVQAFASIPVGRWLDRHGARALMTVGSVAATFLVFAWSRVTSIAAYYLIWAGLGAVMAAVLYEPAFAVVTRWFVRRRARALLTITLVAGMSSTIFLPLTEALVARLGWRSTLAALSLLLGLVTVPLHALVLRRDPRDLGQQPDRGQEAPPSVDRVASRRARASASVALLGAAFVLGSITTAAVGAHMVPLLVERGFAGGTAAALAGAVGLMQFPGRLLHPVLERRVSAGRVTPVLLAALALALLVLSHAHGLAMAVVAAGLLGMANGLMTLARATEVADRCGVGDYGRISGLLAFGTTLARAAGPIGAAWLLAGLGGYGRVLALLGGLSAIAALLAVMAAGSDRPRGPESFRDRIGLSLSASPPDRPEAGGTARPARSSSRGPRSRARSRGGPLPPPG